MRTKPKHTIVVIPNDKKLEVTYYCSDNKLNEKEKKFFTDLVIQLHDCHSSIKISKAQTKNSIDVEAIVQRRVINSRGHLCD